MNRLNRLREGLARTRAQLIARLGEIAGAPPAEFFEQLEITLIEADVGAPTTQRILQQLRARRDATDQAARLSALREILLDVLGDPVPLRLDPPPAGVVMPGVNGAGKTTSIGKLAHRLKAEGRTVLLAAADTFRAAAIDQLAVWAQLAGCDLVAHAPGADPEPIAQARVFTEAVGVTGIVLAKLDGSAKGGAVLAIAASLGLPVKLVGLGEGLDDLQPFDPRQFVDALLPA